MKARAAACTALLGLTLVAVSACGEEWHGTGTVVSKIHRYPSMILMPIVSGKVTTLIPMSEPERWEMDIQASDKSTHAFDFDKATFDSTSLGSQITIPEKK